jgi:hypothetical protein
MTASTFSVVDDRYMHELIKRDVYRVCLAVGDVSHCTHYTSCNQHEDLIKVCKACNRDTTELERALSAFKNAAVHLKHVANMERECLRQAVDAHQVRPKDEDLT